MTTYTLDQIGTRVLRDLNLVAADEVPSADDLSFATETASAVGTELSAIGIAIWGGSTTALPAPYFIALSKRVGLDVGPAFGLFSISEAEEGKQLANMALRRLGARDPDGSVAPAEYF